MAVKIPYDRSRSSEVVILRFSTESMAPNDLKLRPQLQAAQQLLPRRGIPTIIDPEHILFRIVQSPTTNIVEARYTSPKEAQDFLRGGHGSTALQGKVAAEQALIDRCIAFLATNAFIPSDKFHPPTDLQK
jgi:hypothetical protein